MVYGTYIPYDQSKISHSTLKRIGSIIFASMIFLIEEIRNVFLFYKECQLIKSIRKKSDHFANLSVGEKNAVREFYNAKLCQLDRAQKLICRESSIQVVLQLTLIVYQVNFQKITIHQLFSSPRLSSLKYLVRAVPCNNVSIQYSRS